MKKLICILVSLFVFASFCSCADEHENSSQIAIDESSEESFEESKNSFDPSANARKIIKTLDYKNNGKMGDTDGPAFAVYSKVGYNGASVDLNLGDMEINTRLSDGRFILLDSGGTGLGSTKHDKEYQRRETGEYTDLKELFCRKRCTCKGIYRKAGLTHEEQYFRKARNTRLVYHFSFHHNIAGHRRKNEHRCGY